MEGHQDQLVQPETQVHEEKLDYEAKLGKSARKVLQVSLVWKDPRAQLVQEEQHLRPNVGSANRVLQALRATKASPVFKARAEHQVNLGHPAMMVPLGALARRVKPVLQASMELLALEDFQAIRELRETVGPRHYLAMTVLQGPRGRRANQVNKARRVIGAYAERLALLV